MLGNTEWRRKTWPSLLLLLSLVAFVMTACTDEAAWRNDTPMSPRETPEAPLLTQPLAPTLTTAPATPTPTTAPGTYHNPNLGISFKYPPDWERVGDDKYQGKDGFFQISQYHSIASGLSDAYHRVSFRMVRACTWEVNAVPGKYGQNPIINLLSDYPGSAQCLIIPGANAQQTAATMLLETLGGGLALLNADERQMKNIQKTLVFDQPY